MGMEKILFIVNCLNTGMEGGGRKGWKDFL